MSSVLIDRLEVLANRVAALEEELVEEKKKSEKFEKLANDYCRELEVSKGVVLKCKLKLARILKWKSLFDRLI